MSGEFKGVLKPINGLMLCIRFFGIWPSRESSFSYRWLYNFYAITFQIIFSFIYTSLKCINFLYLTDLDTITRAMFICITELSLIIKIINFYFRINQMHGILNNVTEFKTLDDAEDKFLKERGSFFSKIMVWYLTVANMAGIFSYASPILSSEPELPYPGWYPLDWHTNALYYWLIYAYQVIGMILQTHTLILLDLSAIYFMIMIGAHLDILARRFQRIGFTDQNGLLKIEESKIASNSFVDCVEVHRNVLRLTKTVGNFYSLPFFTQFVCSGIVLCVTAFQIAIMNITQEIAAFVFYVSFVMTMLTQIFLPCYFGNEISLKNTSLTYAVYSSNWFILSQKFKKSILLYLMMNNTPMNITVGYLFDLTLQSFLAVLNKAYSLFAVLQSFVN